MPKPRGPESSGICGATPISSLVRLLMLVVVVLGLSACPSVQKPPAQPPIVTDPTELARSLAAAGDYLGAAREYERLAAGAAGSRRGEYTMYATRLYIKAGDLESAAAGLARIDAASLSPVQGQQLAILHAHLALLQGQPQQALDGLAGLPGAQTPTPLVVQILELRARALEALDQPLPALRTRMLLGTRVGGPQAKANNEAVWRLLLGLPSDRLAAIQSPPEGAVLAGWAELARVYMTAPGDPEGLQRALTAWRDLYVNHPAAREWVDQLIEQSRNLVFNPQQIALLLPTKGNLRQPATAIRAGFLAAYFQQPAEQRPLLRIYPLGNDAQQVTEVYGRAVADGAEVVVGPLGKRTLRTLATSGAIQVPTLSLNYLADESVIPPRELYQFGLSPEDEARDLARRARIDGHRRALLVGPANSWGKRVIEALTEAWQSGTATPSTTTSAATGPQPGMLLPVPTATTVQARGGRLLEARTFDPKAKDAYTQTLIKLFNLDQSKARRKALARTLHTSLEFEPRRRKDADVIFTLGFPRQVRQIIPQLAFHGAGDLPAYATSHAYEGRNPEPDLEGLRFGDMPWILAPDPDLALTKHELEQAWPEQFDTYRHLYALGLDAYNVLSNLLRLRNIPSARYPGASGTISMDDQRRLHRQLLWAQVRGGKAELLGPSNGGGGGTPDGDHGTGQ